MSAPDLTTTSTAPEAARADARRNRESVIEAAIGALARDPNASMSEIAVAAGLGRTTVYRHFESREELIGALFHRVIADAQTATAAVIDREPTLEDKLRGLGPAMIEIGERFRFLRAHLEIGAKALAESKTIPDDPVRVLLESGVESGELRADAPISWMQSMMQSSAMATMDEIHAGSVEIETAGALLGELFAKTFLAS